MFLLIVSFLAIVLPLFTHPFNKSMWLRFNNKELVNSMIVGNETIFYCPWQLLCRKGKQRNDTDINFYYSSTVNNLQLKFPHNILSYDWSSGSHKLWHYGSVTNHKIPVKCALMSVSTCVHVCGIYSEPLAATCIISMSTNFREFCS